MHSDIRPVDKFQITERRHVVSNIESSRGLPKIITRQNLLFLDVAKFKKSTPYCQNIARHPRR